MHLSMTTTNDRTNDHAGSALPPIPSGHGFKVDERIELPLYSQGDQPDKIQGVIKHIDIIVGKKHYKGLVLLGDDNRYYEFHPEIARRI